MLRQITTTDTYEIRGQVLRPGLGIEACMFDRDFESLHFGWFHRQQLVSIASLHPQAEPKAVEPNRAWRIRGMATRENFQGRGYGGQLLEQVTRFSRQEKWELLWCNARLNAISFYERHGFEVCSECFMIEGVGLHKVMRIVL